MRPLAALVALIASPLAAEPQPAVQELLHYTTGIEACLASADTPEAARLCIGQSSQTCMDTEEGGHSTVGQMFCTLAEYHGWDRVLNSTYQVTMSEMGAIDEVEMVDHPALASRNANLRGAQRVWIEFRDAHCSFEYVYYGPGTFRQVMGAACRRDITAERTIYLHFLGN